MILRLSAALCLGAAILAAQTPGTLLIASPNLRDEGFARTVILIIQNDGQTAAGLVLNRPLGDGRFAGGPIASGLRSLVPPPAPKDATRLCDGVWLVNRSVAGTRIFAGHTGWTSEQLRLEVRQSLWQTRPATAAIVFDPHPDTLWRRLSTALSH